MKFVLSLFLCFAALVPGQKPVEPIKVAVRAPQNEVNIQMASDVRAALRALPARNIAITSEESADYEIRLNALLITHKTCSGYIAAVEVVDRSRGQEALDAYIGGTTREIAGNIVEAVSREYFRRETPKFFKNKR